MAFTRKVLRDILEGAGKEGFDTEEALDKIYKEHGEAVKSYKTRLEKFDDIDIDGLTSASSSLNDIKKQLNGRKLDEILAENADLTSRIASLNKDKLVDSALSGYKFTSASAERDIRRQVSELELTKDGSDFANREAAIKSIVDANQDAFILDAPRPHYGPSGGPVVTASNPVDQQDAFIARRYGN